MTVIVAAAIIAKAGRVLITQRKRGSHLEGLWEFPGGKVEEGEDPKAALVRELREEVGIDAEVGDIVDVTFHRYGAKDVLLLFYSARACDGSPPPVVRDVAAIEWAGLDALDEARFPPADVVVLRKVRALISAAHTAERRS